MKSLNGISKKYFLKSLWLFSLASYLLSFTSYLYKVFFLDAVITKITGYKYNFQ
jgi:hypothetical protein